MSKSRNQLKNGEISSYYKTNMKERLFKSIKKHLKTKQTNKSENRTYKKKVIQNTIQEKYRWENQQK